MSRCDAFLVSATEPYTGANGTTWNNNIHCGVVAAGIEDAILAFKSAHPNATLYSVSHRGMIEIITADAKDERDATR